MFKLTTLLEKWTANCGMLDYRGKLMDVVWDHNFWWVYYATLNYSFLRTFFNTNYSFSRTLFLPIYTGMSSLHGENSFMEKSMEWVHIDVIAQNIAHIIVYCNPIVKVLELLLLETKFQMIRETETGTRNINLEFWKRRYNFSLKTENKRSKRKM